MKLPKTFVSDKDLEEKTKELTKNKERNKAEDLPKTIETLEDALKYISNSIIPVYGYDERKRIHIAEMTIREVLQHKVILGELNPISESVVYCQGLYFNKSEEPTDISFNASIDMHTFDYKIKKEGVENIKKLVEEKKTKKWRLTGIYNRSVLDYDKLKVNTPKEILWAFDTFKDFKPVIHGGALRDLYLGIARTNDIDIEVTVEDSKKGNKLAKLIKSIMDEVEYSKKGESVGWYSNSRTIDQHRAKKEGVSYDIFAGTFYSHLSTEQIMMKEPGEMLICRLAKNDLDNKQFRIIDSYNIPERVLQKIDKLQGLGLTFLPEDPSDLSRKINYKALIRLENLAKKHHPNKN